MKKIMIILAIFALILFEAGTAAAYYTHYPNMAPRPPVYDGTVRAGGSFPSMAFYTTGLRGSITTHPRQGYNMRRAISSYYYPQERMTGYYGNERYVRRGGNFNNRISYVSGVRGDFIFSNARIRGTDRVGIFG